MGRGAILQKWEAVLQKVHHINQGREIECRSVIAVGKLFPAIHCRRVVGEIIEYEREHFWEDCL